VTPSIAGQFKHHLQASHDFIDFRGAIGWYDGASALLEDIPRQFPARERSGDDDVREVGAFSAVASLVKHQLLKLRSRLEFFCHDEPPCAGGPDATPSAPTQCARG
jgi:hypothetical protein